MMVELNSSTEDRDYCNMSPELILLYLRGPGETQSWLGFHLAVVLLHWGGGANHLFLQSLFLVSTIGWLCTLYIHAFYDFMMSVQLSSCQHAMAHFVGERKSDNKVIPSLTPCVVKTKSYLHI